MLASKQATLFPEVQSAEDEGLDTNAAMRELEHLRRELAEEMRHAGGGTFDRFKKLALYIEAIDKSMDALCGKRMRPPA